MFAMGSKSQIMGQHTHTHTCTYSHVHTGCGIIMVSSSVLGRQRKLPQCLTQRGDYGTDQRVSAYRSTLVYCECERCRGVFIGCVFVESLKTSLARVTLLLHAGRQARRAALQNVTTGNTQRGLSCDGQGVHRLLHGTSSPPCKPKRRK